VKRKEKDEGRSKGERGCTWVWGKGGDVVKSLEYPSSLMKMKENGP
jgi:hypothetical protein